MLRTKPEIAVMGLAGIHNYGDNFILDCVAYLIDRGGRYRAEAIDLEAPLKGGRAFLYAGILVLTKFLPKKRLRAELEYLAVRIRCGAYYRKALENKAALIFGSGSFKYGTQKLWAYYSLAVETAQRLRIPVMFNGMNIQKSDLGDWKCRFLADHANFPCVRMITSRDGESGERRLREEYGIRREICCKGVGDAAFWIPECYRMKRSAGNKKVGINLIYGNIFRRYGNSLTEEELLTAYCGLLGKLDEDKADWELFTNGLPADYRFGKKVLKRYGNVQREIRVPKSAEELLRIIGSYETILGARLHACICAYSLDIPFVGFLWDEKLRFFAGMAGLKENFIEERELSADCLYRKLRLAGSGMLPADKEKREKWKLLSVRMLEAFQDCIYDENKETL